MSARTSKVNQEGSVFNKYLFVKELLFNDLKVAEVRSDFNEILALSKRANTTDNPHLPNLLRASYIDIHPAFDVLDGHPGYEALQTKYAAAN